MVFNESIRYRQGALWMDRLPVASIADQVGTPLYLYSLPRILANLERLRAALAGLDARICFSAKANSSQAVLRALIGAGAGIDAVSGGEVYRALAAGAAARDIVLAGAGKTRGEIEYALGRGVGWINVENALELDYIETCAQSLGAENVPVALRLNPLVSARTHPYMSTGHGAAKFGMTAAAIEAILRRRQRYPRLDFAGLHMHIGSQLGELDATRRALETLLSLSRAHPGIHTLNLGGGWPVAYRKDERVPAIEDFAASLTPDLRGYRVLFEPGRAVVADAGLLVASVLYVKRQAGMTFYILDAGMAELLRPALYQAHHEIVPLIESGGPLRTAQVAGPACESADVIASERELPILRVGDRVAIMTAGAYGMSMASNYNSRPRPAEVVVEAGGAAWRTSRRRERVEDLLTLALRNQANRRAAAGPQRALVAKPLLYIAASPARLLPPRQ